MRDGRSVRENERARGRESGQTADEAKARGKERKQEEGASKGGEDKAGVGSEVGARVGLEVVRGSLEVVWDRERLRDGRGRADLGSVFGLQKRQKNIDQSGRRMKE